VRRVPILLALPEGEEGETLSAALDAPRCILERHLIAALECRRPAA